MTTLPPAASALTISPEYLMPPSAMMGMPYFVGDLAPLSHHGGDLRHADARNDARGADGAGADADLDAVRARLE